MFQVNLRSCPTHHIILISHHKQGAHVMMNDDDEYTLTIMFKSLRTVSFIKE